MTTYRINTASGGYEINSDHDLSDNELQSYAKQVMPAQPYQGEVPQSTQSDYQFPQGPQPQRPQYQGPVPSTETEDVPFAPAPAPMFGNPLPAMGGALKSIWDTAKEQPESPLNPTWGGQLHNAGQAASVVGQTLALPFSLPLAGIAGIFPRATKAVMNAPMQAVEPYGGQTIGEQGPTISEMGQAYGELPQPVKDVGSIAGLIGAKAALPLGPPGVQGLMRKTGEWAIKPKIRSIIEKSGNVDDVAPQALGANTKLQTRNMADIVAKNGLYSYMGDIEKLNSKTAELGDAYSSAAFKAALKEDPTHTMTPNIVKSVQDKLSAQIANQEGHFRGLPMGKVEAFQKALNKEVAAWVKYSKPMPIDGIIGFKRDLGINWKQGSDVLMPQENAANAIRKAAYFAADDLLPEGPVKVLNKKATDLYRVADVTVGQRTQSIGAKIVQNLAPAGAIGATAEGLGMMAQHTAKASAEMAVPLALLTLGYTGYRSGAIGRGLLRAGQGEGVWNLLPGLKKKLPEGTSPRHQAFVRKMNLKADVTPDVGVNPGLSNRVYRGINEPRDPAFYGRAYDEYLTPDIDVPGKIYVPPKQLPYTGPSVIHLPNKEGPVAPGTYTGPGSPPETPMPGGSVPPKQIPFKSTIELPYQEPKSPIEGSLAKRTPVAEPPYIPEDVTPPPPISTEFNEQGLGTTTVNPVENAKEMMPVKPASKKDLAKVKQLAEEAYTRLMDQTKPLSERANDLAIIKNMANDPNYPPGKAYLPMLKRISKEGGINRELRIKKPTESPSVGEKRKTTEDFYNDPKKDNDIIQLRHGTNPEMTAGEARELGHKDTDMFPVDEDDILSKQDNGFRLDDFSKKTQEAMRENGWDVDGYAAKSKVWDAKKGTEGVPKKAGIVAKTPGESISTAEKAGKLAEKRNPAYDKIPQETYDNMRSFGASDKMMSKMNRLHGIRREFFELEKQLMHLPKSERIGPVWDEGWDKAGTLKKERRELESSLSTEYRRLKKKKEIKQAEEKETQELETELREIEKDKADIVKKMLDKRREK